MLTSPVNVTIAAASGAGLKANTASSDNNPRREPPYVPMPHGPSAEAVIEPELPSNSPLGQVNAAAATVANRTVLQELTLNVATMLRIPRRPDENLTQLFLRIIATIEAMSQADRLAFEIRAGLKPLKITLTDLLMALRKPDGPEAARLTAMAEAPAAVPGRTVANAATTTYLEDGTNTGQTEETLAMRAAARNSAAGQSVFSAESKLRAEAPPADAKVLQNQLKSMFEPGDTRRAPTSEIARERAAPEQARIPSATEQEKQPEIERHAPKGTAPKGAAMSRENVTISSANLKLDQPTLDKIRNAAQTIAGQTSETVRSDADHAAADKTEASDRRVQTLLTLKGLAEAVATIPAKAAELLAGVVAEAAAPVPDTTQDVEEPPRLARATPLETLDETALPEFAALPDDVVAQGEQRLVTDSEIHAEATPQAAAASSAPAEEQSEAVVADRQPADYPESQPLARHDLAQHAVPFAYAQVQPAREEIIQAAQEEDVRDEQEEADEEDGREDGERRRPRDEYDEIHDPVAEEEPAIVITRDSSEADRAFALYQRMGGF